MSSPSDPQGDPVFTLDGAGVAAGTRWLLEPTRLELPRGCVTGLIGHNGSGKSTLLALLAGQRRPTCGTVLHGARPVSAYGSRDYARRVAFLAQDMPATDSLTVGDLVALGRYPWHGAVGRVSGTDRRKVADALDATGLAALAGRLVGTLSGGERQRAFIAMLLAQDSACLLLDEPISALDIPHQLAVMGLVRDAARSAGKSVVVVLHDINIAARFCDELVALSAGRVIARDRAEALMTGERLAGIYGLPMGVTPVPGRGVPLAYAL